MHPIEDVVLDTDTDGVPVLAEGLDPRTPAFDLSTGLFWAISADSQCLHSVYKEARK